MIPANGQPTMNCGTCGSGRPPSKELHYDSRKHNRVFDPYSEEEHPVKEERWAIELLKGVLLYYFPPEKPMEYELLLVRSARSIF